MALEQQIVVLLLATTERIFKVLKADGVLLVLKVLPVPSSLFTRLVCYVVRLRARHLLIIFSE